MKLIIALMTAAILSGCYTVPENKLPPSVVVKHKYIFVTVGEEFLEIPPKVPNLDLTTATDKDAANWILDKEERTKNLETKLKSIKTNQQKKLDEIKNDMKIPKEDVIIK